MDKINVEDILQKYTLLQTQFSANPILKDNAKEAIKEIVEAVIDKCDNYQKGSVYSQSLQPIKKEIEYE